MSARQIKATTTLNFEHAAIKDCSDPVTAYVVAGMNIFKDIFSSITDFTGGRSKSYQNTLSSITHEAMIKRNRENL